MQLTKEQLEFKRDINEEENNEMLLLKLAQNRFTAGFSIDDGEPMMIAELDVQSQLLIQELLRRLEGN